MERPSTLAQICVDSTLPPREQRRRLRGKQYRGQVAQAKLSDDIVNAIFSFMPWERRLLAPRFVGGRRPMQFVLVQRPSDADDPNHGYNPNCGPGGAGGRDVAFVPTLPRSLHFEEALIVGPPPHSGVLISDDPTCMICGVGFHEQQRVGEQADDIDAYPGTFGACVFVTFQDFPADDWVLSGRSLSFLPRTRAICDSLRPRLRASAYYFCCNECWETLCWPDLVENTMDLFEDLGASMLGC